MTQNYCGCAKLVYTILSTEQRRNTNSWIVYLCSGHPTNLLDSNVRYRNNSSTQFCWQLADFIDNLVYIACYTMWLLLMFVRRLLLPCLLRDQSFSTSVAMMWFCSRVTFHRACARQRIRSISPAIYIFSADLKILLQCITNNKFEKPISPYDRWLRKIMCFSYSNKKGRFTYSLVCAFEELSKYYSTNLYGSIRIRIASLSGMTIKSGPKSYFIQ